MGVRQLLAFVKEAAVRVTVIMLALILVMIVASRSVEYRLDNETDTDVTQVEYGVNRP